MEKKQNSVIWIQTVSLHTQNQIILINTMQKMFNQGMALPIMNNTGHFLKEEIKKKKVEKSVLKRTKY